MRMNNGIVYSLNSVIPIGYVGENETREIAIDIRPLVRAWPDLAPVLLAKRPGENALYPCVTRVENGVLYWRVTLSDTAIPGKGECVIHMIDGEGRVGKSRTMTTMIERSAAGEETQEPPEAIKPWIDEVLRLIESVKEGYVEIEQGEENAGLVLAVGEDGRVTLRKGGAGGDGVGVESVEQTQESVESGGENVWTLRLTDGTTSRLIVRNGARGAQGERGERGEQGERGAPFAIAKIYSSVANMNAGYATDGVPVGGFVLIETGDVNDEENARLYVKGESRYEYVTDLSGAQGIQGPEGKQGPQGPAGDPGSAGADGKDGTSVTITSVSESSADGGSNVITFSDGKTMTVKNGKTGAQGPAGPTGETGPAGPQGPAGADGAKGDKGDKGDTGEQGPKGDKGDTGAQGPAGPAGPAGSDATVTATNIQTALGYKPASEASVSQLSEKIEGIKRVTTFAELKAATLESVTPIVLEHGVIIEATEMLTFQAGTTLIGNGATIKRATGHENKLLYLHRNCRVQDLVIDGNRSAMVSPTWQNTADIATSAGCVIDHVIINEGNEAICVYGDNCVITNCNINNCGGNGIHFSGSNNTRVENCRVVNANLRSGMGHEDGCIIWSNECDHIVCSNNWCEGGIAGFGSIDAAFNSHVKLTGNTVKDCTVAIDLVYQNKVPHDIVISGNTFIDSGKIDLYKNNNQIYVPGNISVNENLFINTDAKFFHVTDVAMVGNIFKNGCPSFTRCARVTIANNTVNNARDTTKDGIFASKCLNVVVDGNYVRAHKDVLNVGYSTGVIIRNNNIRNVYSPSNTDYCINCNSVKNLLFDGNIVVLYRKGLNIPSYATITNNVILCSATGYNSLMLSDSTTNVLVRGNRISGSKTFSTVSTTNVVEGNDTGAFDDVFVTVTMTLKNLTADAPAKATKGDEFAFTIVPNEGSTLPDTIAITNNGVAMDANEYEYDNTTGAVLIHCVIGDVVITAETEGTGPAYTNLVPTSIDVDGTVYNGTGYMNGKRLSSSGAVKDLSTSSVTGFIEAKAGDVVRLGGVVLASDQSSCYICAYEGIDNNFAFVGAKTVSGSTYGTDPATIVWDGTICTYTIANVSTIEYIRINAVCDGGPKGANMIVTVNEEIT